MVVRVSSATLQVVHRNDNAGSKARVCGVAAQIVSRGGDADAKARVSEITVQAVTQALTRDVRVSQAVVQTVLRGNSAGPIIRNTSATQQVVWRTGDSLGIIQRAWTFDFDGHSFYVLDLGFSGALVYDLLTGQWTRFETAGFKGVWNFKNGFQWLAGKMVVGGADGSGQLLRLNPQSFLDEGWRPVVYEVRGILPVSGVDFLRQYSLRMVSSSGVLADDVSPVLKMQFSDDRGETWSSVYSIKLTPNTRQRVEFRSLGAFTSPGRIFRIFDEGGVQFIAVVEADIGGQDGRFPS